VLTGYNRETVWGTTGGESEGSVRPSQGLLGYQEKDGPKALVSFYEAHMAVVQGESP